MKMNNVKTDSFVGGYYKVYSYTYDANGNIKTVTLNSELQDTYTYDGLNQLIRHDDKAANKSYTYSYDAGGNILNKKEYAYTTGTLGAATKTTPYTYNSTWKDKLTSYDGKAITYDSIGNPLTYNGYTYTWQKGRQLATISGNSTNLSFKYNSDGLRTKKISGNTTTEYFYSGSTLIAQYDGTNWLKFVYSADGEIIGFMRNTAMYYYMKNVQGDVVALLNSGGDLRYTYSYDAWGKCTGVYDESGAAITSPTNIANINPIRYRGYYCDTETNLYYLQSRYYNPEWGRFVNADSITDGNAGLLGNNLFSYSSNNPVNNSDENGHWIFKNAIKWIAKKILKPMVNLLRRQSYKKKIGTSSTGVNFSAAFGINISASICVARDKKGNIGISVTPCAGGGTPAASVSALRTITTAPSIDKLQGFATQIGGSIDVSGISVGAEGVVFQDPDSRQMYCGGTILAGVGAPIPAELHGEVGYTFLWSVNIFDEMDKACDKITNW